MTLQSEKETPAFRSPSGAGGWRAWLWRYGPLLAWVGFIFFASTASFSASNTSRIIRPLLVWLFPRISEATLDEMHFLVRKAAHLTEYAILALLGARAFRQSSSATLRRLWWLAAFAVVAFVALLDEYHQSFLPSRTGTIYDSFLDMVGGATALACAALWLASRRKKACRRSPATRPQNNATFV
jgi:VanZ family protein